MAELGITCNIMFPMLILLVLAEGMASSGLGEVIALHVIPRPHGDVEKLLPAIKFGLIFTAVMFVANAARVYLGSGALIACSFLGGAAEMDAVAFSLIDMTIKATLPVRELAIALLFASLANTLTKGALVFFLGARSMRRPIVPAVVLICAVTIAMIAFYFAM